MSKTNVPSLKAAVDEAVVIKKVTRKLLPFIGLCYIVLYLDRTNIGVAALQMNDELGISASMFGFAAGVYFWSYTLSEPFSNYILTRVGTRKWITRIMITWGIVTIATAFVNGAPMLIVARILLGFAEAGFSPGMLFFVSRWFPAARRGVAMSWIVTFICLSGLLTPICTGILTTFDGVAGMSGWRWLFILTGIPAVVIGFIFYAIIRDRPADAKFLTPAERAWLQGEIDREDAATPASTHGFAAGVRSGQTWVLIGVFICVTFSLNGLQLWFPQMLQALGAPTAAIGWIAAVPSLIAIVPLILWNRHSDRTGERPLHFIASASVAAVGFLIAGLAVNQPAIAIVGFCIAGVGLYSALAIFVTMPSTFLFGAALAAGFGMINGLGNIGGYLGPQVTGWIKEATGSFTPAVLVFGGAMALAAIVTAVLRAYGKRRGAAIPASTEARQPVGS
ncbi:MFS transporter [Microbacterium sp. Leaf288]|uniref:MFS transporter n=1 Tax=Microbacterium sp. Leaf288 TaxID=1736323 RepID=UPI0006FED46C|nr:MFS transporter [Microbacterium sp. Leaf288]KQP69390.1 MFS transporter [Microbacterium sp. Leaf288]